MLAFTLIFRHSDALALSADVEGVSSSTNTNSPSSSSSVQSSSGPDAQTLASLKNTAKNVLRRLSPGASSSSSSSSMQQHNSFNNSNNNNNNYFSGGTNLIQIDIPKEATFVVLLHQGILFLTVNCVQGTPGSPSGSGAVSLAAAYLEEISREFTEQYGQQALSASRPFMFMRFDNFLSKTKKVYAQRNHFNAVAGGGSGQLMSGAGSTIVSQNLLRRQGAAPPTKISFYKLMGLVEPPGFSLDGNNNNFSSGLPQGLGISSKNVNDAKNSLSAFANSLASSAQNNVPGAKKLDREALMLLGIAIGVIFFTVMALYLVFYFFG